MALAVGSPVLFGVPTVFLSHAGSRRRLLAPTLEESGAHADLTFFGVIASRFGLPLALRANASPQADRLMSPPVLAA